MGSHPLSLWRGLLDDRVPDRTGAAAAAAAHREHRAAWYADLLGTLVLPDDALGPAAAAVPVGEDLAATVVARGGAGGLVALARRTVPGLRVVAVETALRDLDDLAGNAGRVVAAAEQLPGVDVVVELPAASGWVRAVEVVEAAGLSAAVRPGADPTTDPAVAAALADQLSVLVEADLPFSVILPADAAADALPGLARLVEALVDGAPPAEAAALVEPPSPAARERTRSGLAAWDEETAARVRRRLRSVSLPPARAVAGLVDLGLLPAPDATTR